MTKHTVCRAHPALPRGEGMIPFEFGDGRACVIGQSGSRL